MFYSFHIAVQEQCTRRSSCCVSYLNTTDGEFQTDRQAGAWSNRRWCYYGVEEGQVPTLKCMLYSCVLPGASIEPPSWRAAEDCFTCCCSRLKKCTQGLLLLSVADSNQFSFITCNGLNHSWNLSNGNLLYYLCFFCQLLNGASLIHWSSDAILWVNLICILCNSPVAGLAALEEACSSADRAHTYCWLSFCIWKNKKVR